MTGPAWGGGPWGAGQDDESPARACGPRGAQVCPTRAAGSLRRAGCVAGGAVVGRWVRRRLVAGRSLPNETARGVQIDQEVGDLDLFGRARLAPRGQPLEAQRLDLAVAALG